MSSKFPSLKMQWAKTGQMLEMNWTSLAECRGASPQWLIADRGDAAVGPRKRSTGKRHRNLFSCMVALAAFALTAPALGDVFNFDGQAMDVASILVNRNALYSGGQAGFVNSALRVNDVVGTSASAFEWSILGRVESASPASQAVGVYGQGAATAPGVQVWGGVSEARDATGPDGSPAAAATLVGHEVDIVGGGRSIGIDVVAYHAPANMTAIRIGPAADGTTQLQTGIAFSGDYATAMISVPAPREQMRWVMLSEDKSVGIGILTIQGRPTICIYADGNCRLL